MLVNCASLNLSISTKFQYGLDFMMPNVEVMSDFDNVFATPDNALVVSADDYVKSQ